MKKVFTLMMAMVASAIIFAQNPVITFDKTTHDFGKINESDGRVTTIFTFKNEGMAPLALSNVRASCGCTTPKWTKEPIEPGQTGEITVTYNPNGRPGRFQKTITVTSNASEGTVKLFIKGEVIPKAVKSADSFPIKIGSLNFKSPILDMGNIYKDSIVITPMEYANQSNDTIRLVCTTSHPYFYASASKAEDEVSILPHTKGQIFVRLDAAMCKLYGPIEEYIYLVTNGKGDKSKENALIIRANVIENFSHLTASDREKAPMAAVSQIINLGTFTQDKQGTRAFHIGNAGQNPLMVRRIIADDSKLKVVRPSVVRTGKKGAVKVTVLPMPAGNYSTEITIITNDPANPVQVIQANWTVEK